MMLSKESTTKEAARNTNINKRISSISFEKADFDEVIRDYVTFIIRIDDLGHLLYML